MKKYSLLFKDLILLVTLLLAMVFATFAWFQNQVRSNVDGFTGDVVSENLSEISGNGTNWGFILEFDENGSGFLYTPVTGNGTKFFTPTFKYVDKVIETATGSYTVQTLVTDGYTEVAQENLHKYLYTTNFFMRNSLSDLPIFLSSGSYLNPIDDLGEDGMVNGELSSDAICGATRVALHKKMDDGSYKLLFIWAPNAAYQLIGSDESGYTFSTAGTAESTITYRHGKNAGDVVTISTLVDGVAQPAGLQKIDDVVYLWGNLEDIVALNSTQIDTSGVGGQDYEYKMTVWVEGEDRECNNRLTGGRFDVKLLFSVR